MTRHSTINSLMCAACLLSCLPSMLWAASQGVVEEWISGTGDWVHYDPLNVATSTLSNSGESLEIIFTSQSMSMPEVHVVRADLNASSGNFAGDYWSIAGTNVSFDFMAQTVLPGYMKLYFSNPDSGNHWMYTLVLPSTGQWHHVSVPLDYWSGWWSGSVSDPASFKADLQNIDSIGLEIIRNSSTAQQNYYIDNFVLLGTSRALDSDGDKLNDWAEFLAGSDASDPASSLFVSGLTVGSSVAVQWPSTSNRSYSIWASTAILSPVDWVMMASGIAATPPINVYNMSTSSLAGARYFKIELEP